VLVVGEHCRVVLVLPLLLLRVLPLLLQEFLRPLLGWFF